LRIVFNTKELSFINPVATTVYAAPACKFAVSLVAAPPAEDVALKLTFPDATEMLCVAVLNGIFENNVLPPCSERVAVAATSGDALKKRMVAWFEGGSGSVSCKMTI